VRLQLKCGYFSFTPGERQGQSNSGLGKLEWFIRESRSEPAEALGLAVVMLLGNVGFGGRRVKFCEPCFLRYVIKLGK